MQINRFDVIQPPNAGELETMLREKAWFGSVVLDIVVLKRQDELAKRRGDENLPVERTLTAHQVMFGEDPFIVGHLDDEEAIVARLDVDDDDSLPLAERPLTLSVFDPHA